MESVPWSDCYCGPFMLVLHIMSCFSHGMDAGEESCCWLCLQQFAICHIMFFIVIIIMMCTLIKVKGTFKKKPCSVCLCIYIYFNNVKNQEWQNLNKMWKWKRDFLFRWLKCFRAREARGALQFSLLPAGVSVGLCCRSFLSRAVGSCSKRRDDASWQPRPLNGLDFLTFSTADTRLLSGNRIFIH